MNRISETIRKMLWFLAVAACVMVPVAQAEARISPDNLIQTLFEDVNARLKKDQAKIEADKSYLVEIGNEMLIQYISFETMAKQILGKNWRKITPDQRERYTSAFRDRIASTVVSQYEPGREYDLEVTGSRQNDAGNRALVNSVVTDKKTGEKFNISYKMFLSKKNDNWQIYDVAAEGVSVLQSFKSASAEEFRRNGIEYMIAQLENNKGEPIENGSQN